MKPKEINNPNQAKKDNNYVHKRWKSVQGEQLKNMNERPKLTLQTKFRFNQAQIIEEDLFENSDGKP